MSLNPIRLFHKPTVDDWKKKIEKSKKGNRGFVFPLTTPGLTLSEKYEIEKMIPRATYQDVKGIRWLESQIQLTGPFEILQLVRYHLYLNKYYSRDSMEWCHNRVIADIEMGWIVQREVYLRQEVQAVRKVIQLSPSDDQPSNHQVDACETELKKLNDEYWIYFRKIGKLDGNIPKGPLQRGFEAWRNNPNWYLSAWMRQDCARKGGCCGRTCGCCEKARDTDRAVHRGHCTTACGCCTRTRNMANPEKLDDLKDFPFDLVTRNTPYSLRLNRAYIWGVEFINEFD